MMMNDLELNDTEETKSIDIFIGNKLRNLRQKLGMTILQIAQHANVSMQLVQKYETGLTRIPVSILCRLAQILNTRPEYFFEGFEILSDKSGSQHITAEKTNKINILLISVSLEIDYLIQSLAPITGINIITYNLPDIDKITDFAQDLKTTGGQIPMPDIILYNLPTDESDIKAVMKKIRIKPLYSYAPVIVLSMNSSVDTMIDAYRDGVAGYIYSNIPHKDIVDSMIQLIQYWGKACNLPATVKAN